MRQKNVCEGGCFELETVVLSSGKQNPQLLSINIVMLSERIPRGRCYYYILWDSIIQITFLCSIEYTAHVSNEIKVWFSFFIHDKFRIKSFS